MNAQQTIKVKSKFPKSFTRWVDLRKRHLQIRLAENTYFKEIELKAKIHSLKAEVVYIEGFIAEQNNGSL